MKKTPFNLALALILSSCCGSVAADPIARSNKAKAADAQLHKETVKSPQALRRLDFRIKGRGCALCLLDTQKRLRQETGTVKTVVQLRQPYGAVVIYDGSKTSKDKLLKDAKGNKAEAQYVSFLDITDQPIAKVPVLLVPFQPTLTAAAKEHR